MVVDCPQCEKRVHAKRMKQHDPSCLGSIINLLLFAVTIGFWWFPYLIYYLSLPKSNKCLVCGQWVPDEYLATD